VLTKPQALIGLQNAEDIAQAPSRWNQPAKSTTVEPGYTVVATNPNFAVMALDASNLANLDTLLGAAAMSRPPPRSSMVVSSNPFSANKSVAAAQIAARTNSCLRACRLISQQYQFSPLRNVIASQMFTWHSVSFILRTGEFR
jgi:hypothetical protein